MPDVRRARRHARRRDPLAGAAALAFVAVTCCAGRPPEAKTPRPVRSVAIEPRPATVIVADGTSYVRVLHDLRVFGHTRASGGIGGDPELLGFDPGTRRALLASDFWNDAVGASARAYRVHVVDYGRGVALEHWDASISGTAEDGYCRRTDRYGPAGLVGGGVFPFGCFGASFEAELVRFGRLAREMGDGPDASWWRSLSGLYFAPNGRFALMPRERALVRVDLETGEVGQTPYDPSFRYDLRVHSSSLLIPAGSLRFSPDSRRFTLVMHAGLYVGEIGNSMAGQVLNLPALLDLPAPPTQIASALWADDEALYVAYRTSPDFGRSPVRSCVARVELGASPRGRVLRCMAPAHVNLFASPDGTGVLAVTRRGERLPREPSGYLTFRLADGAILSWTASEDVGGLRPGDPWSCSGIAADLVVQRETPRISTTSASVSGEAEASLFMASRQSLQVSTWRATLGARDLPSHLAARISSRALSHDNLSLVLGPGIGTPSPSRVPAWNPRREGGPGASKPTSPEAMQVVNAHRQYPDRQALILAIVVRS